MAALDPDRMTQAWCDRLRETLPSDLKVTRRGSLVRVVGSGRFAGHSSLSNTTWLLRLPVPNRLRLRFFFENELLELQDWMSLAVGNRWPEHEATPLVRVREDVIELGYASPGGDVAYALRPIAISDVTR